MSSSDRVITNYRDQKPNRNRGGRVYWDNGNRRNIFCEGTKLYSYGYHFPLASLIGTEHPGTDEQRHVFVKNGDRVSSTTSGHQSETQRLCPGPTVSRTALRAAGIDFDELGLVPQKDLSVPEGEAGAPEILFWRQDSRVYVWRHKDGHYTTAHDYPAKRFTPPDQGMFVPLDAKHMGETDTKRKKYGCWHVLGAAVIEQEGKYYLCGLDGGTYFVCQLPRKPRNCDDAYEILKPREVRAAEKQGIVVPRQGEWFFVPTDMDDDRLASLLSWTKTKLAEHSKVEALPHEKDGNLHVCRHLSLQNGKRIYARGKVFHRSPFTGQRTGQHQTVDLGDQWHVAYHNTAVRSWSMSGRFD